MQSCPRYGFYRWVKVLPFIRQSTETVPKGKVIGHQASVWGHSPSLDDFSNSAGSILLWARVILLNTIQTLLHIPLVRILNDAKTTLNHKAKERGPDELARYICRAIPLLALILNGKLR